MKKILVFGLPGAGKTTFAKALAKRIGAVHLNADAVRENINRDLGFTPADRVEHARRMGWLCDRIVEGGGYAIADFVCPTKETREAFGWDRAASVWANRIGEGRYEDTNRLFELPAGDHLYYVINVEGTPEYHAEKVARLLSYPDWDDRLPTALLLGRFQPFHDGHLALAREAVKRVGQVLIAVRRLPRDEKNPLRYEEVKSRIGITMGMAGLDGRFRVISVPNITNVFYGRDVGYKIEELIMPEEVQAISATKARRESGIGLIEKIRRTYPVDTDVED